LIITRLTLYVFCEAGLLLGRPKLGQVSKSKATESRPFKVITNQTFTDLFQLIFAFKAIVTSISSILRAGLKLETSRLNAYLIQIFVHFIILLFADLLPFVLIKNEKLKMVKIF